MKAMIKKDFILLKAVFNKDLHDAVLNKDLNSIESIVQTNYNYELNEGMVEDTKLNQSNVNDIYNEHLKQINKDNFEWAL